MTSPQGEISEPVERRNHKRTREMSSEDPKRRRKEEKENRRSNSSTSSAESENVLRRDRKAKPVKWQYRELTTSSSSELREQLKLKSRRNGMFLTRNVVQRQRMVDRDERIKYRKRSAVLLRPVIEKLVQQNVHEEEIFSLFYSKIQSWASLQEAANEKTNTSLLETFAVFVYCEGNPEVVPLGASVLPLVADKSPTHSMGIFIQKRITCPLSKRKALRQVYLAVVATRMVPKVMRDGRRTRGSTNFNKEVEPQVRFGAKLMHDDIRGIESTHWGLQHIILVNPNECENEEMFHEGNREWMSKVENLELIDRPNKRKDNSHLARVLLSAYPAEVLEEEMPEEMAVDSVTTRKGDFLCPIRGIAFECAGDLKINFNSRYPCYQIQINGKKRIEVHEKMDFFGSNVDLNANFYRNPSDRSCCPMKSKKKRPTGEILPSFEEGACNWPAQNPSPRSRDAKFGLDFFRSKGQMQRVFDTEYKDRTVSITTTHPIPEPENVEAAEEPTDDMKKKKKSKKRRFRDGDQYAVNNAKMFCDVALFHQDYPVLNDLPSTSSEMKVVTEMVTREDTIRYNESLLDGFKMKNKQGKVISDKNVPPVRPTDVVQNGVDFEGNQIPTFSQLFFPQIKSELYNILLRFFVAEKGLRPGAWNAAFQSRVMCGFLEKFHKEIFDNELKNVFLKHVQVIGMAAKGWKSEDSQRILSLFRTLYDQWMAEKSSSES